MAGRKRRKAGDGNDLLISKKWMMMMVRRMVEMLVEMLLKEEADEDAIE